MQQVEIWVKGKINRDWSDWLGNLTISHTDDGNTLLHGTVHDQSVLYGLLSQLSNLGIQLISVSLQGINSTQ